MTTAQELCQSPANELSKTELGRARRWKRKQADDPMLSGLAETVLDDQPTVSVDKAYRIAAESLHQETVTDSPMGTVIQDATPADTAPEAGDAETLASFQRQVRDAEDAPAVPDRWQALTGEAYAALSNLAVRMLASCDWEAFGQACRARDEAGRLAATLDQRSR
ncbi:hypothetical protein [Bifidobacterium parmae]|uniref:Uncharacterized protein n=1 Tax=Bifidobacterium parmae TaxID=361854 RepID=A0A2N5IVM9_9BIFI|nr:hypothetical protein [Bifidobacterium parmae]PLS26006.1 hypothetical protein Uis4E_2181 [Bifidobacterium parmae]